MAVTVNLRHLEAHSLHLEGEVPPEDLDVAGLDELIRMEGGVRYDLEVERHEDGLLVQGRLSLTLQCVCARCLEPFRHELVLPEWCSLLPWAGEDPVNVRNDCVDLTPYIREDMVLALPQRPLCKPECGGLQVRSIDDPGVTQEPPRSEPSPAWAVLNNLKL
jgi:uncharacterized protein